MLARVEGDPRYIVECSQLFRLFHWIAFCDPVGIEIVWQNRRTQMAEALGPGLEIFEALGGGCGAID
jgi:hypothetical protein